MVNFKLNFTFPLPKFAQVGFWLHGIKFRKKFFILNGFCLGKCKFCRVIFFHQLFCVYCAPDTPTLTRFMDCPVPQPPHLRADAASASPAAPPQRVQLLPLAHLLAAAPGAQRHRHSRLHHTAHAHCTTTATAAAACACATHTLSLSVSTVQLTTPHWCDDTQTRWVNNCLASLVLRQARATRNSYQPITKLIYSLSIKMSEQR